MRYFKRPIPKGYQIYSTFEVTGLHIDTNRDTLDEFMRGNNLEIAFEHEPQNIHDHHAIRVVGTFDKTVVTDKASQRVEALLGYIPRQISEGLHSTGIFPRVIPRLYSSSEPGDRWVDMTVDILGPKEASLLSQYHNYFEEKWKNLPASPRALAFLRLCQYELDEDYTNSEAESIINYIRQQLEAAAPQKLVDIDTLLGIIESTIDEFSDVEILHEHGLTAISPSIVVDAVVELSLNGVQASELAYDYESIAEEILRLNPSLASQ